MSTPEKPLCATCGQTWAWHTGGNSNFRHPYLPEKPRPSLDDTLAHIDDALAEPISMSPCLVCPRAALLGSAYCAAHKPIPREMIEGLDADFAAARAEIDALQRPAPAPGWLARALHRLFRDGAS